MELLRGFIIIAILLLIVIGILSAISTVRGTPNCDDTGYKIDCEYTEGTERNARHNA